MHAVKPYPRRVHYVGTRGVITAYSSPEQAVANHRPGALRALIGHGVGHRGKWAYPPYPSQAGLISCNEAYYGVYSEESYTHALLGEDFEILTEADFPSLPPRKAKTWLRDFGEYKVKHPGRKRGHHYSHRRPRTTAERRQNALVLSEEGEPPVRGGRRPCQIPNAWDDLMRSDANNHSWKRHRSHQYKEAKR